ncbi:putative NAD dependent epimerase/dehydratase [Mollisia scopiformis]|uniref:Putative NAD dependent epimerase/dehydratase n=1 Tax=Mollisia scopiformis TaxID=149040 RepID=A0A194WY18_MOLSC|nr:putative NAD dependent epimerase/dehydratase [Mollisia scopiformis]KUJ12868.1 putative NAD dependent epimerase/dehydratase [Mollisia scopiformis]
MIKLIVILGITGEQGSSIASHFLTLPSYTLRGLTRKLTSPAAQSLLSRGISLHACDLNDPSTLPSAFAGAHTIFATTDFWGPFYNPSTQSALGPNQSLGEYCYEIELQQVKNIFDAAAKTEGLQRLVISTLVDVQTLSGGRYENVFHCDGKARGVAYGRAKYPELWGKVDQAFVPNYMSNWLGKIKLRKEEDGSWRLGLVGTGARPLPHLDVEADLGAIVAAILEGRPGKKVLAAGDMVSWSDQMRIWCEMNKVPFGGFDSLPIEVFDKFFPIPGLGRELGEMMEFMEVFGYVGGDPEVVLPGQLESPPKLTSWREYVEKHEWSSILNA